MSRMEHLFFFDKEVSRYRRKYKRYRKQPELLPFSVRLTGLSGAVRVEAYLKQQQKAKESKTAEGTTEKTEQEHGEITLTTNELDTSAPGQAGAEQNQTVLNNLYKLGDDLKQEEYENKERKKLRSLPLGFKNFGTTGIKSFEQLDGDDEEEDTQRFLFEENKFAAPNLLAQLGKLLDFLHGKQVEELEDILSTSSQLDNPSIVVENLNESQTLRGGGVILDLSEELTQKLLNNYEGLCANVVYVKREWQTASYREQAILLRRLGNSVADFSQQLPEGSRTDIRNTPSNIMNDSVNSNKLKTTESKDSLKKGVKKDQEVWDPVVNSSVNVDEGTVPQILIHQRESKSSVSSSKPRTRIEKFKYYVDKPDLSSNCRVVNKTPRKQPQSQGNQLQIQQGHTHGSTKGSVAGDYRGDHVHFANDDQMFYEDDGKATSEVPSTSMPSPGQPSVINFSLLSRQCEDKGWVVHQSGAEDLERQTMIEWARARLLQVMKERDEAALKAKEVGEDGPVIQKCYGDAQLQAALKYKKGVSWAKRWMKMTENDKKPKFLISVPDGTTFCYYPSGRMAVCAIKPGVNLAGQYTFVYGDSDDQPMLATFTPTGLGCCYNASGSIRFIATAKFGALMEKDGKLEKKWRWPIGKLQSSVVIQLNQNISLRCISQTGVTLYFNCQNESAKFCVGMVPEAKSFKIEELGYLQTDNKFTSQAALQSIKVKTKKKDKRRKILKAPKVDAINEEIIEERQKELEEKFPERKELEIDAPWQLELLKLQRKVKNLVYDWMEHYRISVGIVSPKRAYRQSSLTHSAKSLPGTMPSTRERRRGTLSGRSPSAPPIPRAKALTTFHDRPHSPTRSHSSAGDGLGMRRKIDDDITGKGVTLEVPKEGIVGAPHHNGSIASGHSMAPSRFPFRCGLVQRPRSLTPPKKGCCVALRAEMLGEKDTQCRCDRRRIPLITDLEYDVFLKDHVARTQMVVISVTSSLYPDANPCDGMLDQLFYEKNRNRSIPCVQARNDPFRLLRYDIAVAASKSSHVQPLLLTRHNAVPGMFLMYVGARLLFADHIFNGYGNAKKDFLKQIMKTRKDSLVGNVLPYDFRLTPARGRSGPRAAWGGEIGGPIVSNPQLVVNNDGVPRITSACTQESASSLTLDNRGGAHSAASFINFGLSINSPYPLTGKLDNLKELPKLNTVA